MVKILAVQDYETVVFASEKSRLKIILERHSIFDRPFYTQLYCCEVAPSGDITKINTKHIAWQLK